jgi:flagella basal body P-ring formation protein FlgA
MLAKLVFFLFGLWFTGLAAMPLEQMEKFVSTQVVMGAENNDLRVKIEIGQPDPRLKLRTCTDLSPFIPPGSRLWGRTYLGIRCNEKPVWTTFIPVHVHVFATVPVAARLLTAGQELQQEDIAMEERDITRLSSQPVLNLQQVKNRVLMRGFAPGQPLLLSAFRLRPVLHSGDSAKIIVRGEGFAIMTEGTALASADAGEPVRIRLENGKIMQGVAQSDRRVEIRLQ